ncbi:hypothetical protein GCM10010342_21970 [Streptomyces anulatus]|nr:hypothetical protein IQ60_19085 [Streptomyces europaeiscabiei]GGY34579.1 hypothetical protein GCM10010342_21970 [Streptomyces anulatus]
MRRCEYGRKLPTVLGSEIEGIGQEVHRAQPVIGGLSRLQPADGAHAHPGPLRHLFLRQSRLGAQAAHQYAEPIRHFGPPPSPPGRRRV